MELSPRVATGGENPEGGGQVVEESSGGDSHTIEDGSFERAGAVQEKDQQVQDEDLDSKTKQGGGVVVEGLAPVGRPVVEGPEGVEKVVGPTAEDPGESRGGCDDGVVPRMPAEVVVAQRKNHPDYQGV